MNINKHIEITNIINNRGLNRISESSIVIEKKISSGGYGKVIKGKYYDIPIIIKLLRKQNTQNYTHEISNITKFRHPNIPKFLGVCEYNSITGLVFEYIEGKTLSQIIISEIYNSRLQFVQKLDYLIQLASIIEFLHDHGLIHRDIKPDNIIIDKTGCLKLLDYGISISEGYIITGSCRDARTELYTPPEYYLQQDDNENDGNTNTNTSEYQNEINIYVTNKFDIWSFSLICCELFSLTRSWTLNGRELNAYEIITMILLGKDYPINKFLCEENLERNIKIIIKNGLKHDPKERANIKEIKDGLIKIYNTEIRNLIKNNKSYKKIIKEESYENTILSKLKRIKHEKEIEILINQQKLMKIEDDLTLINNSINKCKEEISDTFKAYSYMTYDDKTGDILILEFPKKRIKKYQDILSYLFPFQKKRIIKPYCINYKNKLYIIGGNICNDKNHNSSYVDSNMCISYDNDNKEIKLYQLNNSRLGSSAVIFREKLYVIGGNTTICECLDVKNAEFVNDSTLLYHLDNPILINYNDEYILCINFTQNKGIINIYYPLYKNWETRYFETFEFIKDIIPIAFKYDEIQNIVSIITISNEKKLILRFDITESDPITLNPINFSILENKITANNNTNCLYKFNDAYYYFSIDIDEKLIFDSIDNLIL